MNNKIKESRKSQQISQEKLAEMSGVSRTIISGIESGRIEITTTATLKKISKALGKTVEEIFFSQ